ncbi:hypothetical protein [Bdellovibrio sp. HCB337]|uniref:hypothetical protein n=1 Tax=Bdellovibrio sp. HCB337 TaxID=3394358 RepID=UPI0039A4C1E9
MTLKTTLFLYIGFFLVGCSVFSGTKSASKRNPSAALTRPLGLTVVDVTPEQKAISLKVKFNCLKDDGGEPHKIRSFKYKIKVTEGEKEIASEGTQRTWLEPNVSVLNLKYPKSRNINFKSLEISSHTWIRSFSELQLSEPVTLSLSECKALEPY